MHLSREQRLSVSRQVAWSALRDLTVLRMSIPGCESLTQVTPDEFDLTIGVSLGLARIRYRGKIRLEDSFPPERYTLRFEDDRGESKLIARMWLEAQSERCCVVGYFAEAMFGGGVARFGTFLVDLVARKLADDFFAALKRQLYYYVPSPLEYPANSSSAQACAAVESSSAKLPKHVDAIANGASETEQNSTAVSEVDKPSVIPGPKIS